MAPSSPYVGHTHLGLCVYLESVTSSLTVIVDGATLTLVSVVVCLGSSTLCLVLEVRHVEFPLSDLLSERNVGAETLVNLRYLAGAKKSGVSSVSSETTELSTQVRNNI